MNVTLCERVWVNYAKESYDYRLGLRNGTKEGHLNGMRHYSWAPHLVCCTNVYLSFSPISPSVPFSVCFCIVISFFFVSVFFAMLLYLCISPYLSVCISVFSLCVYFSLFFYISLVCVYVSLFLYYLLCASVSLFLNNSSMFICISVFIYESICMSDYFSPFCLYLSLVLSFSVSLNKCV